MATTKGSKDTSRPVEAWAPGAGRGSGGAADENFEARAFEIYLSILTGMYAHGGTEVIRFEPLAERAIEAAQAFDETLDRHRQGKGPGSDE